MCCFFVLGASDDRTGPKVGVDHVTTALVLGSTGRLGRLMRHLWQRPPPALSHVHWVGRHGGEGILEWAPSDPTGALPRADVVIALWGVTKGDEAALSQNVDLGRSAMELAVQIGASRILLMSSAAVYGPSDKPLVETAERHPLTPYGMAKCAMEDVIQDWCDTNLFGPETCVLRLGNVAAADQLFASLDGKEPVVLDQFDDGMGPSRSYLAPRDLARALGDLATCPDRYLPRFINVAGPRPVQMEHILRASERPFDWRAAPDNAQAAVTLDTTRISRLSGELVASSDAASLIADWRDYREGRVPLASDADVG